MITMASTALRLGLTNSILSTEYLISSAEYMRRHLNHLEDDGAGLPRDCIRAATLCSSHIRLVMTTRLSNPSESDVLRADFAFESWKEARTLALSQLLTRLDERTSLSVMGGLIHR